MKRLSLALAMAALVVAVVGGPGTSRAAEHEGHVRCEVKKGGKTETKMVKSADDCTKLGGTVATSSHKKK